MMTKEEFISAIEDLATKYANSVVYEPEEHEDAVASITDDYLEGAYAAYELLVGESE